MKINPATPSINPTPSNNVAFKGNASIGQSMKKGFSNLFTLEKDGPMSRPLFIVNAFAFLLGTRLLTSRDKDEIRETLIRDVPTIIIAVLGVPVLGKMLAKGMQKHSGFALLKETGDKNGKIAKWIDEKLFKFKSTEKAREVGSHSQLDCWYTFNKNSGTGFKGFTERLSNLGGNIKKIFSKMDGVGDKLKSLPDDNDKFISELFDETKQTSDNVAHKDIVKELAEKFALKDNTVHRIASFKKTITEIFAFTSTILLCGLIIPKTNIAITEALHKNKAEEKPKTEKA